MKRQGGQDIVEFALMLPLFLVLLFGIMYCGFLYGDYVTLNNVARSAAREAVITGQTVPEDNPQGDPSYQNLEDQYTQLIETKNMTTKLYLFDGISITKTGEKTSNGVPPNSVKVVIKTKLNTDYAFLNVLTGYGIEPLKPYIITYYMYDENGSKTSTTT
uniref:TadE/TadG family type IV pilus assembly protein n=1 Tax=Dialister massiliensis TaxID=2161821 RepID=UPI000D557C53|nr:TadE/TadG family type IV pilus assembly protein [Dialister massiliensis]